MSEVTTVHRANVSSKKVAELVFEKIFPALQGEPINETVFGCICAAILAMRPNCPFELLQSTLLSTTAALANQLQDNVDAGTAN